MSVVQFPKQPGPPELLVGPFTYHKVVVDGRAIPRLTGYPQEDGRITLIVDGRFAADFDAEAAHQAAWLIAQALAIGEGYSHLGATSKDRPFAPTVMRVDGDPSPTPQEGEA